MIATAREWFPDKEGHRRVLAEFIDTLPKEFDTIANANKLAGKEKAEDTLNYMLGKAPVPPLLFGLAELDFLSRTFRLTGNS